MPNILASVGKPDLSTTLFGRKIDMPIFLSPAAMQRLYHHEGDIASARAAEKFGTFYSMSTMATSSIEEIATALEGEIESNAPDFANDSIDLLPPILTSVFEVKSNKSL